MQYVLHYRRPRLFWPFWRKVAVVGHHLDTAQNKLVLFFPNGSVQEIAQWASCEMKLGTDWVLAQKKAMEQQAGQPVSLAVGATN